MEIPLKTRTKTTIWPSNPTPRHIPWGKQNWKKHMYSTIYYNPLQCSCLENPRDGGAWWAAVYGVAQSWTWLKRLSSSSSNSSSSRTWKQPRSPSTDEWIKKLWYTYTVEHYSAIKRTTFESVLMRWMNLEPIIQSEVSQKEKNSIH